MRPSNGHSLLNGFRRGSADTAQSVSSYCNRLNLLVGQVSRAMVDGSDFRSYPRQERKTLLVFLKTALSELKYNNYIRESAITANELDAGHESIWALREVRAQASWREVAIKLRWAWSRTEGAGCSFQPRLQPTRKSSSFDHVTRTRGCLQLAQS